MIGVPQEFHHRIIPATLLTESRDWVEHMQICWKPLLQAAIECDGMVDLFGHPSSALLSALNPEPVLYAVVNVRVAALAAKPVAQSKAGNTR
ncbi:hypothetical protein AAJV73_11020 [Cyanobium sp. BSA11S]